MATTEQYPVWVTRQRDLRIEPGTLDIWFFSLDAEPEKILSLSNSLSPDERLRAGRFATNELSVSFILCRGTLRFILAHYLSAHPGAIAFGYNAWGKPGICAPADTGIGFNLSHSGETAMVAVTRGDSPGADIERMSCEVCCEEIARREFTRHEQALFFGAAPESKQRLFFTFWTRKEAVLKGIGEGLSIELSRVDVSDIDSKPVFFEGGQDGGDGWRVMDIPVMPGYAGACAYRNEIRMLRYFDADE